MKNFLILIVLLIFEKSISQNQIVTKAKFMNVFEFSSVYDYTKEDNDTLIKSKSAIKLPEKLLQFDKETSIKLLTKFKIIYNNSEHNYIKYLEIKNKISQLKIIDVIFQNNIYVENKSESLIFNQVKRIISSVNAKILFEFYNKLDNESYPEINKLKPLVKSTNGVLDINKLADQVEKNKTFLSKYID